MQIANTIGNGLSIKPGTPGFFMSVDSGNEYVTMCTWR